MFVHEEVGTNACRCRHSMAKNIECLMKCGLRSCCCFVLLGVVVNRQCIGNMQRLDVMSDLSSVDYKANN